MYGDKSIYCPRCKRETWYGDSCPVTNKTKKCLDGELERLKKSSQKKTK